MIKEKISNETAASQRAIERSIRRLKLDLSGLTIYTEAGSGFFCLTAPLAALAGADRVIALARPWSGKNADEVGDETRRLAGQLGVGDRVSVVTERSLADFSGADVVTNLGFVRPLDRQTVMAMKPGAAIPYMREAWERREGEIDWQACRERGISVFATNENDPCVRVFESCGHLAAKMMFEAGEEILDCSAAIISDDPFGGAIAEGLRRFGAEARVLGHRDVPGWIKSPESVDVLIIADFCRREWVVARGGLLDPGLLAEKLPRACVIAFAGGVDGLQLAKEGVRCWPLDGCLPQRMSRTLAHLGPGPVAMLHGAGLKVGAAAARGCQFLSGSALSEYVLKNSPAQILS